MLSISCNDKIEKKANVIELCNLIKEYDPAKEYQYYNLKQPYSIADSLDTFFKKLDPNKIIEDTSYRKAVIYLLEKKYFYIYATATNKNAFYISNASAWGGNGSSIQFALNIFNKTPHNQNENYNSYVNRITDVTCIDFVIGEAKKYSFVNEEHKKIHSYCVRNIPTKCKEE